MATLEKIRSKGVLLLVVVGAALLAFIVGDFLNSGSTFFQQSREVVGKIDGQIIKIQEFDAAVKQLSSVYQIDYNVNPGDEAIAARVQNDVWNSYRRNILLDAEAEKIGLTVNENELNDITIGNNPHRLLLMNRQFANPQTGFDKTALLDFVASLAQRGTEEDAETFERKKNYWKYYETEIRYQQLEEKYMTLLSKAVNINSVEAKMAFEAKKTTVDVAFLLKPYHSVADDKVTVSDKEIADKYNELKEQRFRQTAETRDIKYVVFDLQPSPADFEAAQKIINDQQAGFTATTDIALFLSNAGATYLDAPLSAADIDPDLKDFAFSGKKDEVLPPTLFGNSYKMARIIENGIVSPDSARISQIVVFEQTPERTKQLADSLLNAIKGGADFAQLAAQFSKDPQTAANGGDANWVMQSRLEPELAGELWSKPINETFIYNNPNNENVAFILKITEKTKPVSKVKLAVITSEVKPSRETINRIFSEATAFAVAGRSNAADFEKIATEKGYVPVPYSGLDRNTPTLGQIRGSRKVIQWAFKNDVNTVSEVEECGDNSQYVVAVITGITPEGFRSLESVTPEIKGMLLNEKKAELIIADLKGKNMDDLAALATAIAVEKVDTATSINFAANNFGKAGFEPEAVVQSVYSEKDKTGAPVKGRSGVIVSRVFNQFKNETPFDVQIEKMNMSSTYMNSVYRAEEALFNGVEVEDNRYMFY